MKHFLRLSALVLLTVTSVTVHGQCAMCRTQVVNNVSAGETDLAAGLNLGIMYLFTAPYLLVGVMVFLWFRYGKVNEQKIDLRRLTRRKVS